MKYSQIPRESLFEIAQNEAAAFRLPSNWRDGRQLVEGYAIDAAHVPDVDDAVIVTAGEEGASTLTVSIADTGSFLSEPSAIRTIARRKGWTQYRNSEVVDPMLPKEISEDALSFLNSQERPAVSVHVPVDAYGNLSPATVTRGIIRAQRFTPEQVDTAMRTTEAAHTRDSLAMRGLYRTAQRLHQSRTAALALYDYEDERNEHDTSLASFMVRESMIAANRALAQYRVAHHIPGLFRVFEPGNRAFYSTVPNPHAALGVGEYSHDTSPLRRFPDFANQANLLAHLEGREYPYGTEKLEIIAGTLNARHPRRPINQTRVINQERQRDRQSQMIRAKEQMLAHTLAQARVRSAVICTALFYDGPDPTVTHDLKTKAMQRLAKKPLSIREVLHIAITRGVLRLRLRQPTDPHFIRTSKVIEDSAGNVYSYYETAKNKGRTENGYGRASDIDTKRRVQIERDGALLSHITGIKATFALPEPKKPSNNTAPNKKQPEGSTITGHSAYHCLRQHLIRTTQSTPRYSFTRHREQSDTEEGIIDCTIYYTDTTGRAHVLCATAAGRKKAKALAAEQALYALQTPIIKRVQ